VRSYTFLRYGEQQLEAVCAAAVGFAQARLNEGYTTVVIITSESELAKRYSLPADAIMVRYWGKGKTEA
jgi:hypothetical protein